VADKTRTWHADSTVPYALAALVLFEFARTHREARYAFGPMTVAAMTDGGLWVAGDPGDVEAAALRLKEIPGLTEYVPPISPGMSDSGWVTREGDWVVRADSAGVDVREQAEDQVPVGDPGSGGGGLDDGGAPEGEGLKGLRHASPDVVDPEEQQAT
jgi:hypothetical protein